MPIEIKELHIRIAVNAPQGGQSAAPIGGSGGKAGDNTEQDKDAMVADCVEQVLQILRNKEDR